MFMCDLLEPIRIPFVLLILPKLHRKLQNMRNKKINNKN